MASIVVLLNAMYSDCFTPNSLVRALHSDNLAGWTMSPEDSLLLSLPWPLSKFFTNKSGTLPLRSGLDGCCHISFCCVTFTVLRQSLDKTNECNLKYRLA